MPTTTNFGWTTPADTDLVKDGALAIRTLGNGIDTSMMDLKGGTTGQVLSKTSNTDMDFSWIAVDPLTILDAKGDLISATAADTPARLAVGTNGQVLTADSTTSTGLKWATAASGALILTGSSDFTTSSSVVVSNCFSSTYDYYVAYIDFSATSTNAGLDVKMRSGSTSASTNYSYNRIYWSTTAVTAVESSSTSSMPIGEYATSYATRCGMVVEFIDPGIARATKIMSKARFLNTNASLFAQNIYGDHSTATAYDSLEIIPGAGTISGSVRVYGYAKS
jgi:hypothetical protein